MIIKVLAYVNKMLIREGLGDGNPFLVGARLVLTLCDVRGEFNSK